MCLLNAQISRSHLLASVVIYSRQGKLSNYSLECYISTQQVTNEIYSTSIPHHCFANLKQKDIFIAYAVSTRLYY